MKIFRRSLLCFWGALVLGAAQSMASPTPSEFPPQSGIGLVAQATDEEKTSKKKSKKKKKEEKSQEKKEKKKFSWDGTLKFSFRIAKNRDRDVENKGGFEFSALNIKSKIRLQDGLELRTWYQVDPIESDLKEGYGLLKDKTAFVDRFQVGLQKRLFYLESDLETDSLNKIAFYRMRDLSLMTRVSFLRRWQWLFQFANGGQLDTRDISPRRVNKQDIILSDSFDKRQATGSASRELLTGLKYEVSALNDNLKEFGVLVFGSYRPISDDDSKDYATLADVPGYTGVNVGTTSYTKIGLNSVVKYLGWRSYSQIIEATFRDLNRTLFTTELSYKMDSWFPLVAYSQQSLNVRPEVEARQTYQRSRITLGTRYQWKKNMRLAIEATHNGEDSGDGEIYNDEFITTWVFSF